MNTEITDVTMRYGLSLEGYPDLTGLVIYYDRINPTADKYIAMDVDDVTGKVSIGGNKKPSKEQFLDLMSKLYDMAEVK